MHSQLPNANKLPNAMPSRRPSAQYPNTQYPKPALSTDPRLANSTNYSTDNRVPGPPYDQFYSHNQDNWSTPNTQTQMLDSQKQYLQNDPSNAYGSIPQSDQQQAPASYRLNRQDALQHQQSMDQSSQQYINQGRRLSSAVRQPQNQRQPQEWSTAQNLPRRQSVLAQPNDAQQHVFVDGGTAAYGRNEFRSGTVYSEGPLDRTQMSDQAYRQAMDQGYRQPQDQQGYARPDQQMYRQPPPDQQGYRQTAPTEQDIANGTRQVGQRPSIDYFDHYKRPPSRDSSVDRYGRRSRQPSVEATAPPPSGGSRAGSVAPQPAPASRPASRAATPAGNGHLATGRGSISRASSRDQQPFEDSLLRKRTLGQEISPSPYQPKRTESLFVAQNAAPPPAPMPSGGGGGGGGGRKVSFEVLEIVLFLGRYPPFWMAHITRYINQNYLLA